MNRGGGITTSTTIMMLTDYEKNQATAEVCALNLASGQEGRLLRAQAGERLFGSDGAAFIELGVLPLELVPTPPVDLAGKIDAIASVLPEADVRAEDRLEILGVRSSQNACSLPRRINPSNW